MLRIPNEFIRNKALEKRIWYVGSAMFHVLPWASKQTISPPDMESIPLWAHLIGLPLYLRSLEGLSFAAGLIGEPKETDEFTKNLTGINKAHVKIEANLTRPLPSLIELKRTTGEIIPVTVEYPWVLPPPPSVCSFCNQISHILKDCLTATLAWVEKPKKYSLKSTRTNPKPSCLKHSTHYTRNNHQYKQHLCPCNKPFLPIHKPHA